MAAEDAIVTYSETETEFLAISLPSTGVQGVGRDDVPHRVAIFYLIFCASKVVFFLSISICSSQRRSSPIENMFKNFI